MAHQFYGNKIVENVNFFSIDRNFHLAISMSRVIDIGLMFSQSSTQMWITLGRDESGIMGYMYKCFGRLNLIAS